MDVLLFLDRSVFLLINHLPHTVFTNFLALFISGIGEWGLVWFFAAMLLFMREEKKDHMFFLPFLFSGIASFLFSEVLIKWVIARPRPFEEMGAVILATPANYSFPSTHATLAWSLAVVLSSHEPKYKYIFYTLAMLISLSRVYLGVHYPLDVFCGAVLGIGIGKVANALELTGYKGKKRHTIR